MQNITKTKPIVSVVIPTYNSASFLAEAIDSVLNQTFQDFELLIVNDGSNDNTDELVKQYIRRYPNIIRYFYQNNRGPGAARNRGIQEAEGELIAFLDADDYYMPFFLEKSLSCLQENNYDLVITKCECKRNDDYKKTPQFVKRIRDDLPKNYVDLYKKLFIDSAGSQNMLVKKECFSKVGLYDEKIFIEDWDIWVRFAYAGLRPGVVEDSDPLWIYRIRQQSRWHNPNNQSKKLIGIYFAYKKHRKSSFSIDPSLKKFYAEKLWHIGIGLLKLRTELFLAIKILIESQWYELSFKRIIIVLKKLR